MRPNAIRSQFPRSPRTCVAPRRDATRDATQDGLDDDACLVIGVSHDFVPGYEGERDDRVEVARRATVDRGEVTTANAGETRSDAHPIGSRKVGRVDVDEPQGADTRAATGEHLARDRAAT